VSVTPVSATPGTLLVEQGVHIRVVQEILGHAWVTTTEHYTHVAGALMQDASTRMGPLSGATGDNCNPGSVQAAERPSPET
jgi:hypothetical protein